MRRLFILKLALGVALIVALTSSSTYYTPLLMHWANGNIRPFVNLYRAHIEGEAEATQQLSALSGERKNLHWQQLLADEGIAQAQFSLANTVKQVSERKFLLRQAAASGHADALYQLGLMEDNATQKVSYLQRAAEQEFVPAMSALYQWYWMQGNYAKALPWMKKVAIGDAEASLRLAQYYWNQSEYDVAQNYLLGASDHASQKAKDYLRLIDQYWQRRDVKTTTGRQCHMQLQFISTGLDSTLQAEKFKTQFESDPVMSTLPICINELLWVKSEYLGCNSQAVNNYRISCRLEKIDSLLEPHTFSQLVIFHGSGKANVTNGVMYLDLADKYSVFIHELAHFVGFIDEYPLSNELADLYCQSGRRYPNLLVLDEDQSIEGLTLDDWQQYGEALSLAKARTCNNSDKTAYKLSGKMTFMEFHDSNYIPALYLSVWKNRLQSPIYMKPAALNIAQALEDVGKSEAAQAWWMRFHEWRTLDFLDSH